MGYNRLLCFQCYKPGHYAGPCPSPPVCGHCAEARFSGQCSKPNEKPKCSNCGGLHKAWSQCCQAEVIAKYMKVLVMKRQNGPSWYRDELWRRSSHVDEDGYSLVITRKTGFQGLSVAKQIQTGTYLKAAATCSTCTSNPVSMSR